MTQNGSTEHGFIRTRASMGSIPSECIPRCNTKKQLSWTFPRKRTRTKRRRTALDGFCAFSQKTKKPSRLVQKSTRGKQWDAEAEEFEHAEPLPAAVAGEWHSSPLDSGGLDFFLVGWKRADRALRKRVVFFLLRGAGFFLLGFPFNPPTKSTLFFERAPKVSPSFSSSVMRQNHRVCSESAFSNTAWKHSGPAHRPGTPFNWVPPTGEGRNTKVGFHYFAWIGRPQVAGLWKSLWPSFHGRFPSPEDSHVFLKDWMLFGLI